MKLVLLSGGSGKRLWPMSNDTRSKQFLKVLDGGERGRVSMLQRVWEQVERVGLAESAYLCASKSQVDIITAQLGDVSVIAEPTRRDTFPAIALASAYLSRSCETSDDAVVVAPVDHAVEPEFFEAVADLPRVLQESGADMALLGVAPTQPSSQYGYIRLEGEVNGSGYARVQSFTEKPDHETARRLVSEGGLWNCGVFCFRLGYLREFLRRNGYPSSYAELLESYGRLPKRSFDYEVVEQAESIAVRPFRGRWKDLGTWGTLAEELNESFVGHGCAEDCDGSHVFNELNLPVVAKGLRNVMVVATPDGILVADKAAASDIKQTVADFCDRPRYEERRWGTYRVLDHQRYGDGTEVLTKSIELNPGANISYHRHLKREEVWTVVRGHGEVALGGTVTRIEPGDIVRINPGQWHAIRAVEPLSLIEVQRGTELTEEDVLRRYLDWREILDHCVLAARR